MGFLSGKQATKPEFAPGETLTRRVLALLDDGGKGEEEVTASTLASELALPVSEVEAELKTLVRFGNLVRRTGKNGEAHYSATPRRKLLGDLLVESGHLSAEHLKEALDEQARTGERLGVILLDRGYVTKQIIGKMLEMQRGIPYVNLSAYPIDEILVRSLPERVIMEHKIVPLARSGDEIHLAMLDPSDIMAIDTVGRFLHGKVRPFLTTESDFSWVVNKYFGVERKVGESLTEARPGHEEPEAGAAGAAGTAVGVVEAFDDSPVVRVLNTIVQDAVRIGATDIHVEPEADETPVRFRIDGLLVDKTVLPRAVADGIASRLKVLAGMDIAERIRPQDGRVLFSIEGREYDLRIATLGTAFGERVAIRLLNNRQVQVGLERLGLSVAQQTTLERLMRRQHGMVLVTGPTGSGKSTTLAAMLDHANKHRKDHIITLEDPIEFVHQSQGCVVNHREIGSHTKSFAAGLRGALREDPDIILVGEMRDLETISLALEAAATGHLVFATLHTTSAAKTVDRVIEVFPHEQQNQVRNTLSTSLKLVVAQNLFKRIDMKGRCCALEVMVCNPAIANLIRENKTFQIPSIIQVGKKYGMQTLDDAIMEVLQKKWISPEEAYDKCMDKGKFAPFLKSPPDDMAG